MADEDFNMIPIPASSQVAAVGFNPATRQGKVEFHSGSSYVYENCDQNEFDAIVGAPSVGSAFNSIWKGLKPYSKVG